MSDALAALYETIYTGLVGDVECGDRAYPDMIPANVQRPYFTWFFVAGGEENAVKHQDAIITVTIKCVAETLPQALRGAGRISETFNDRGGQECGNVTGIGEWQILTVTQGRRVHLVETFENARPIYHSGHQFEFVMERVS